jgi:hypothetical protein
MVTESHDTKKPTSPLLRGAVAVFFLLLAAAAIFFAAQDYRRNNPPVDESETAKPNEAVETVKP